MRIAIAGLVILAAACGDQPAAPDALTTVRSIRYVRERPFDPEVTGQLLLHFNSPIPGDPYNRLYMNSCALEVRGNNTFACPDLMSWQVPADSECTIWVYDPAVTTNEFHMVATGVFVNDQRVRRVEISANGVEIGRFRITSRGEIQ